MDPKRLIRTSGGDNPGTFLPAMLEGKQTVIGEKGGVRMAVYGEDAAFVRWFMGNLHKIGLSKSALY